MKYTSMPLVGERIGPYRITGELGAGGMATVYRADGPTGEVALKVLHPSRVTTEERKRFDREYLTLKRLSHPHVVRVFDAGVAGEHPYLALELVEGTDLGSLLDRWEKKPPTDRFERVESIFRGICEALGYIHEQGLVHRDLKPGNILVSHAGVPKLSDFGVVKDTDHFNTSLTIVGRLVGTVAFMAPEQIMGEKVDSRADLYSLGAILYNLLTGKKPVQADSIAGYLSRHLSEAPRPPSELDPTIPRHLERVCLKLLEKDPARRYVSARQVLLALAAAPPTLLPIHGRGEELRQVQDRVRALVKEGVGGVIAVVGGRGSGRTRLLLEIAERGREQGLRCLMVGATPDALEQLLEGLPTAPTKGELSWRLMEGLGDTPTLLVVDDLDLAPPAVAEGLLQVLQQKLTMEAGPLLLVCSCLPEGLEPPARVVDAPASYGILSGVDTGLGVVVLRPGGLDREAVRGMLRDRGLSGGVGAVLGRRLQEELAGVPGLILEQLEALGAAGWVQKGPDGMLRALRPVESFRGSEPLPLPDRVRSVEARFLEQLPVLQREVVEAVAVLRGPASTPASVPLLLALTGASDGALQESLRLLERQGLLELREEGMEEVYSIPSARRAQVAMESMAPERRMLLHRVAALAMQQLYRRRLGAIAEVAAWHMIQGGDPAGAYPLLIQGAGRALRRGDTATARQLSQRALEAREAAEAA
ncbi:MAG TPA: protein kinase, partial [Myxococcota bacterium]|nr:protein kinase [Myxococcota bacterium]